MNTDMKNRTPDPARDNKNWEILFTTQFENLQRKNAISRLWIAGLSRLGLDQSKAPNVEDINRVMQRYTRFIFEQTDKIVITSLAEWSKQILLRRMPITNFVRSPVELNYCDEPDKWHDIIGHIPFLTDEGYVRMYQRMSKLYLDALKNGERYGKEVASIIAYTVETGLIREGGSVKALGATLYSSSGELDSAYEPSNIFPATLDAMLAQGISDRSKIQGAYFVLKSVDDITKLADEYRKKRLEDH